MEGVAGDPITRGMSIFSLVVYIIGGGYIVYMVFFSKKNPRNRK